MSTYRVTYFVNTDPDKYFGYRAGQGVTEAFAVSVSAETARSAAEQAYVLCQRLGTRSLGEVLLDQHEAPSMSVGDVVLADVWDEDLNQWREADWLVVAKIGFEVIDPPRIIARDGRSVADVVYGPKVR